MENKINLVEILKDCPKGMELDCTVFKGLEFDHIDENNGTYPIICRVKTEWGSYNIHTFTKYGCYSTAVYSKCVIFPKGKNTWEGFHRPFKDGDIVTWKDRGALVACIYKERKNTSSFYHHIALYKGGVGIIVNSEIVLMDNQLRLATEEEKQKLFDAMKDNGYKWNPETKTLEKLIKPKFKVDDKIKLKGKDEFGIITQVSDCFYTIKWKNNTHCWPIKKQDDWELINELKFKVGDRIRSKKDAPINISNVLITKVKSSSYEGVIGDTTNSAHINFKYQDLYELVPNKFDITTLVPFESRVLVRDSNTEKWKSNFWGFYDIDNAMKCPYECCGCEFAQCIPYENNEHLLGATDDCNDYYKTWE
jgi:hypothetical protein